jgi:hypothetical protein
VVRGGAEAEMPLALLLAIMLPCCVVVTQLVKTRFYRKLSE